MKIGLISALAFVALESVGSAAIVTSLFTGAGNMSGYIRYDTNSRDIGDFGDLNPETGYYSQHSIGSKSVSQMSFDGKLVSSQSALIRVHNSSQVDGIEIELRDTIGRTLVAMWGGTSTLSSKALPRASLDFSRFGYGGYYDHPSMGIYDAGLRGYAAPQESLKNSIEVSTEGPRIQADFVPKLGGVDVDLRVLAGALEIDHFNWFSQIISIPDHWELIKVEPDGDKSTIGTPYTDPAVDWPNRTGIFSYDADEARTELIGFDEGSTPDSLPYYYNEPNEVNQYSHEFGSLFVDSPRFPSDFMHSGDYVEFETSIVGVRQDGSMVSFDDIAGTKFRWKSNAVYQGGGLAGGVFFRTLDADDALPTVIRGGVFDIEFVNPQTPVEAVPEPSTIAIWSLLGCVAAGGHWLRKRKAAA